MMHAVILAGGWGRRLWPKTDRNTPKQLLWLKRGFNPLQSLLQIIKPLIPPERIWVVTDQKYLLKLRQFLPHLSARQFLIEPMAKNTAAAIGFSSLIIKRIDPEAITLVLSSDQMIKQKRRLLRTIKEAARLASQENVLVAIGVRPQGPAAEYGYLKIAQGAKLKAQSLKAYKVEKFIEKPTIKKAKRYLRDQRYLWNSGIFAWRLSAILKAIEKYLPKLSKGLKKIENSPAPYRQLVKEYQKFSNISIDYGVLEKARNIYTVQGDFTWQDLGSWNNLCSGIFTPDKNNNISHGLHKGIDTKNSLILSDSRHLVATAGLKDLIIVHTPKVTLVCAKNKAQEVKKLTQILEKDKKLRKYL